MTYDNDSAMKRKDTAWQEGRDVWWQVNIFFMLHSTLTFLSIIYLFNVFNLSGNLLQDVVPSHSIECEVEWVDAEDTLFLLYTSGSTGKPKVITHFNPSFFHVSMLSEQLGLIQETL